MMSVHALVSCNFLLATGWVLTSLICFTLFVLSPREKIMTTPRKEKKREARREEKAEKAAVLDKVVEPFFLLLIQIFMFSRESSH